MGKDSVQATFDSVITIRAIMCGETAFRQDQSSGQEWREPYNFPGEAAIGN